jgi:hypothetical protein
MKAFLAATCWFLLCGIQLQAQEVSFVVQGQGGTPVRELHQKVGGLFFPELTMGFLYQPPMKPVEVGINIGYSVYGTKVEQRRDLFPGSTDQLRIRRNNNLLTMMGVFRYTFDLDARVVPFLEVQMGGNYFYTRYKIRETIFDEPFEEGRDLGQWVLAYRGGGGLKIPFKKSDLGYFEFRVLYHESGPVRFLRRQDTIFNPATSVFEYTPTRSAIHLIQFGMGIVLPIVPQNLLD